MRTPCVQAYDRTNLIRLHVIGNSNSKEDQAVKIRVRNRIIKITEPLLIKVENPEQAEVIINRNLAVIQRAAQDELKRNRRDPVVQVSLGEEFFPKRIYPFGVLPEGRYKGLLVKLGKGMGRNWWCILYPPLCLLSPDAPAFRDPKSKPVKVEYRLLALEKLIKDKGLTMDSFWIGWAKYFGIM
jgi:stage II sporulation protein R